LFVVTVPMTITRRKKKKMFMRLVQGVLARPQQPWRGVARWRY